MGVEYTTTPRIERITCDASECCESIKPRPDIADSGWVKCGVIGPNHGDDVRWYYCPAHSHLASTEGKP